MKAGKASARATDESVTTGRAVEPSEALDGQATKTPRTTLALPLDAIRVGDRHRRDLGDIDGLAASIAEVGLLQPIAVTFDGYLIAGERRLRAVELLGWKTIPYTPIPINLDQIVRGEFAENTCRKDFTLSEAVAIKRALEPLERAAAKERQREGGRRGGEGSGKLPEASKGNAADKAAKATGMARRTLEKAAAIVDAAESEPEKYGRFLEKMDRTGRANGVYRQLRTAKQAESIRAESPPLPGRGPYRVLVADPGWPYDHREDDPSKDGVRPYPTESIERICKHDVASIVHDDAILFLWVVNFVLVNGLHLPVLQAWGNFRPITLITWNKGRAGTGDRARSQTEHAISLCPAPRYVDLFSRYRHNEKWDCHGDEAPHPLDIPPCLRRVP